MPVERMDTRTTHARNPCKLRPATTWPSASKPGTALLRLNRYRPEEVPRQLQQIAELQQWLEALARAARKELEQGHRINL